MNHSKGFTLIELVTGIVVLAISLTLLSTLLFPQARNSVDAIQQVRATELGNALMSEILARRFDEQSSANSNQRCGEGDPCTAPANLGPDGGETRADYDDVDDYDGLAQTGTDFATGQGNSIGDLYNGFALEVSVHYDENRDGVNDGAVGDAKLIRIVVTTPSGTAIPFASYRGNY